MSREFPSADCVGGCFISRSLDAFLAKGEGTYTQRVGAAARKIFSSTGIKYRLNNSGFSLMGKWPISRMVIASAFLILPLCWHVSLICNHLPQSSVVGSRVFHIIPSARNCATSSVE